MEDEEDQTRPSMKGKRKKEEEEDQCERKKKRRRRPKLTESSEEKKKKGQSCGQPLTNGSLSVCVIIKMPLETEFWKLKTPKMCFQFP